MLSCGAAFSLREANDTEMKTTFTPYDSDDVLTATVNGSGDESKITLSAQDSSNTGARIMRFATDLAARWKGAKAGAVIGGERTMWDMSEHVEHGFGPVWDSESRILVLGSMPSPKSRKAAFYYMHPQNRFWPVMQALFADPADPSDVTGDSLQSRRAFAMRHHIALWDVIASCDITGASDASIRNATPNDLTPLLRDAPIARIFTTGAKSAQLYRRLIEPRLAATGITIGMTPPPSTTPAQCRSPPPVRPTPRCGCRRLSKPTDWPSRAQALLKWRMKRSLVSDAIAAWTAVPGNRRAQPADRDEIQERRRESSASAE